MWILVLLAVIVIIAVMCSRYEGFSPKTTVTGGVISTKMDFGDHSTVVRKLVGDSDKTIILLHNVPFNMEVWDPLYMYTQSVHNTGKKIPTCISYDLLGWGTGWKNVDEMFNDANPKNSAWTYTDYTHDLYRIYKEYVGNGKVTIVGYGFGGSVAQAFALEYPQLVNELYVLSITVGPTVNTVPNEIEYLSGWIAKNPLVPFLTMENNFVQLNLCSWFQNRDPRVCPYAPNRLDKINTSATVEYLLGSKMFREASCQSFLQIDKLEESRDLLSGWEKAKVNFPVIFLAPNRDNFLDFDALRKDIQVVSKASPSVKLYIVDGKHGFVLMEPEYIYKLITGEDMSKNPLTVESS